MGLGAQSYAVVGKLSLKARVGVAHAGSQIEINRTHNSENLPTINLLFKTVQGVYLSNALVKAIHQHMQDAEVLKKVKSERERRRGPLAMRSDGSAGVQQTPKLSSSVVVPGTAAV